jgi:hypothetical protein
MLYAVYHLYVYLEQMSAGGGGGGAPSWARCIKKNL